MNWLGLFFLVLLLVDALTTKDQGLRRRRLIIVLVLVAVGLVFQFLRLGLR